MRHRNIFSITTLLLASLISVGQDMTITGGDAADGLDLTAVGELFRKCANSEKFERELNDQRNGINNLDLNEDGEVDYLRVLEQSSGQTRIVILQVPLGDDEFQDVATLEVEKQGHDYNVQIHGNAQIYGANHYVYPPRISWGTVGFVSWLFAPRYRPYVSPYRYGYYPSYYRRWQPVTVNVYRTSTVRYTRNVTYRVAKTSRVVSAKKIYTPKSSVKVTRTLRNPTASQKTYKARTTTKTVKRGGFDKKTTTTSTKAVKKVNTKHGSKVVKGKKTTKTRTTTVKGKKKTTKKKTTKTKKTTVKKKRKKKT